MGNFFLEEEESYGDPLLPPSYGVFGKKGIAGC